MKKYYLLFFILFLLVMSWENQKEALAAFADNVVPQQSIRLRILANSDTPEDQRLKREVRDRVIASVHEWAGKMKDINEARTIIGSHLPELQKLVDATIREKGFSYASHVELAATEFPTKMYGTQVFPAGQYEAVRITIGDAQGKNWWCVLFPALCFVDIGNGDAAAQTGDDRKDGNADRVQIRFFLIEWFHKLFA
ncbi:stage II sporulation protein R [Aneurinibacillus sp. BA2021]|nr:stage II sporulation protein R [Aneurinibacillus sp. BA2021]